MNRPDAKTVLMFALSADAFVEDERLSAESGMNGHFAKPVVLQHCSAALASFCASAAGKRENEGVPETPKTNRFLQRQKQFCVCGICVIFVVLSYTVKWEC